MLGWARHLIDAVVYGAWVGCDFPRAKLQRLVWLRTAVQRRLSTELLDFRQRMEEFIRTHWRIAGNEPAPGELRAWHEALVAAGWSVPHWPRAAGGAGWSPTQLHIWRQACAAAGVPLDDDIGVEIIGPLLLRFATPAQQRQYLPGIRTFASRWCIGFAEPQAGTDHTAMRTTAAPALDTQGWRLNGVKTWVAHTQQAHWICCYAVIADDGLENDRSRDEGCAVASGRVAASQVGVFAVPLDAPGVELAALTTFDGSQHMAEVTFTDTALPGDALLARSDQGAAFAQLFFSTELSTLSRSAVARAQLQVLDETLGGLDPADDLHAKRHALAVELEALEAMELRYLDARQRNIEAPFPFSVLRIRSREILLKLGALQVESFGYYALPYPDEMLLHNEGAIGPAGAAATVRRNLAQQVAALYEDSVEQLRDSAWRELAS